MAKTTTTTKAKTNTSKKKPAAKTAVKKTKAVATKATKTSTKTTVKTTKTNATKSKVTISQKSSRFAILKRAHVISAAVLTALAVAAGLLMNSASAQVLLGHLTKDELASRGGAVFAPAAHVLYEVEFRWLLVALLAVSAVIALLRGIKYAAREEAGIKARVQPLRWIDFAITGSFAYGIVALLNGLQDAVAVKYGAISIVLAALLAWLFERENAATNKPARATYVASAIAVAVPVIMLVVTMYATYVYGMVRSPWYAYAAALIVSFYLLATVRSTWSTFKRRNGAQDYFFVDRTYNTISTVSKVALAVVLIVGLYSK